MKAEECVECLENGLKLLEDLLKITDKQLICIRQNELRGLRRLMREREKVFYQLMAAGDRLRSGDNEPQADACAGLLDMITVKQQEVLAKGREVVRLMTFERNQAAAELRRMREQEHVNSHYVRYWYTPRPGNRFDEAR